MLLVSDNTAVRMCGRVVPAVEINEILAAKGFVDTRVEPVANPNRFFLGDTTPRETHDLLWRLATKTLLSPGVVRLPARDPALDQRIPRRHPPQHVLGRSAAGSPPSTAPTSTPSARPGTRPASCSAPTARRPWSTALFAEGLGDLDNYGATHPAVEAHAVLGRTMFDVVSRTTVPAVKAKQPLKPFTAVDGG